MNRSIITIGLLLLCSSVYADKVSVKKVIWLESKGNPLARSRFGARGLMQVTPIVLKEYNRYHKTEHKVKKLYNPLFNVKVGKWYLHKRIPQMLKYYKKEVSVRNILIAYNAGISYVRWDKRLPSQTRAYIRRYNK